MVVVRQVQDILAITFERLLANQDCSPRCALVQSCVNVKLVVRMNSPAEQWCICLGVREHSGSNYGGGIFRIMVIEGAYLRGRES